MRRLVLTSVALAALAVPVVAAARSLGPNDGTLVVRNADNGDGISATARPVVTLVVTGFVIGQVSDQGRIQIFSSDPNDTPEVTGATAQKPVTWGKASDGSLVNGTQWSGPTFRFRAVDGTYRILIWGSGVYLFAGGRGTVQFAGSADDPTGDGQYSLNGADWHSIPFDATKTVGAPTSS